MPEDLKIGIRLTADGKGFVGEIRASARELDKLSGRARKAAGGLTQAEKAAQAQARSARRGEIANRGFAQSFIKAHGSALKYIAGIGGLTLATRGLLRHADSYTQISNAVRIATDTAAEHRQVQQQLFEIAQRTRAPLAGVADLYQKIAISQDDLGASNDDLLAVIEGVGQALLMHSAV